MDRAVHSAKDAVVGTATARPEYGGFETSFKELEPPKGDGNKTLTRKLEEASRVLR